LFSKKNNNFAIKFTIQYNIINTNNSIMKKRIVSILFLIISLHLSAQDVINTGKLLQGGLEDGVKLVDAYITPINKAIVYGLSDVTYTKIKKDAKHRLLLGVKLAYVSIPGEDLVFDVNQIGLKNFVPKDPAQHLAPTVFGDSLKVVTLVSKDKDLLGRPLIEFDTPGGGQSSALPLPYLSATYRLKYTNINFNFIPYVQVPKSDLMAGMMGITVQQDLAMFVKALKDSNFGVSLQAGGSYLHAGADLHVEPNGITSPVSVTGHTTGPYDNQKIVINYSSIHFGAYLDYTIKDKFTVFAGSGYNTGTSSIKVEGTFPIYSSDPTGTGSVQGDDINNPLDLEDSFSRLKFDIGARADFKRFYVQLNYNIATYGGLGLNLGYKML